MFKQLTCNIETCKRVNHYAKPLKHFIVIFFMICVMQHFKSRFEKNNQLKFKIRERK